MKNYIKPLFIYLIFNVFFYIIIFTSLSTLEHEQKSQTANATTRLVREKILIKDYTGLTKDLEKIKSDNFSKIITFDSNNNIITETVNTETFINLKVKRYFWSDSNKQHLKGTIVFYFSLVNLFLLTFKILFFSTFVTFPLGILLLKYIKRQQTEAIEFEKNKILNKFTRQMSHDIRSPIASLHHLFDLNRALTEKEMKIFKSSLDRIDYIANNYLNVSKGSYNAPDIHQLAHVISEIINEKQTEYHDLKIKFESNNILAIFVKEEFKRILSNLVNNSYEASNTDDKSIEISVKNENMLAIVEIKDNGIGIPKHILDQLGHREITTKNKGNGLGLLHAVETLNEWNASLKITKSDETGTIIRLEFPKISAQVILIDDDDLVRMTWSMKAKSQKIDLKTFRCYEDFITEKPTITRDSTIYIDSELGPNIKGEDIASTLHSEGFTNIFMATGHAPENFKHLTFLKGVISKSPPFK